MYQPLHIPTVPFRWFRYRQSYKIFWYVFFKKIQKTDWERIVLRRLNHTLGSKRLIGTLWLLNRLRLRLSLFLHRMLILQILIRILRVVRLSHIVKIRMKWLSRARNLMGLTFRYDSIQLFDTKFEYKEDKDQYIR